MPRPKGPPPTLPTRAEEFLGDVAHDKPKTEASYRCGLVNLQVFAEESEYVAVGSSLPPEALVPEFLAEYYSWLRGRKYSNATVRLYLVTAGQYLDWLEADGKLRALPFRVAEMRAALEKKTGRRNRRIRPGKRGSDKAIGALLDYYKSELAKLPADATAPEASQHPRRRLILLRNHALLQVLYATAGRAAEVASLQRADVSQGHASYVEIIGKGERRRKLILTGPAKSAIRAYLDARHDRHPGLFISHGAHAGESLTTSSIWRIVNDAARAVFGQDSQGRPLRRAGPHAFRHLRAQRLLNDGMRVTTLQTMLGHASVATTRDTYAPETPEEDLTDELRTFDTDPSEVARRGREALGQSSQDKPRKRDDESGKP